MASALKAGPGAGFMEWAYLVFSRLNSRYEQGTAESVLSWAIDTFGTGLTIGTSFGVSGLVLMDLAIKIQPDVDIFYIDTGYFFPETNKLIDKIQDHYQRSLRRVLPEQTIAQQTEEYGPMLYQRDPDLCCQLRKVVPLHTALQDSTAWATAIRRDQASTRSKTPAITWNERHNVVKIAPLINWREDEIWDYVRTHKLPYNQLHDQNYPSIGCAPCTRPVQPGEDLRAGRWQGKSKIECGLHVDLVSA